MNRPEDNLNKRVRTTYGPGGTRGTGRIIAYCDAPTYVVEYDDGRRESWRVDLCVVGETKEQSHTA